jgi:hypothetical protein
VPRARGKPTACQQASIDGTFPLQSETTSLGARKPSLIARFGWWTAESLGHLTDAHIAALPDEALLVRAEGYIRERQPKKAARVLDALAKRPIEDPKNIERLAHLQQRSGAPVEARVSHLRAAQAHLQRRSVPPAVTILKQVVSVSPDCVEARLLLAQIYESVQNFEDAANEYIESAKVLTARKEHDVAREVLAHVRKIQRTRTILDGQTELAMNPLTCNPDLYGRDGAPVPKAEGPTDREPPAVQAARRWQSQEHITDSERTILDLSPASKVVVDASVTEPQGWAAVGKEAADAARARARIPQGPTVWDQRTATDVKRVTPGFLEQIKLDTPVELVSLPENADATIRFAAPDMVREDDTLTEPPGSMVRSHPTAPAPKLIAQDPAEQPQNRSNAGVDNVIANFLAAIRSEDSKG